MLSGEYAKLQERYVGTDALFAAKTESLLQDKPEDLVVIGNNGKSLPLTNISSSW
jgi:hypothetical protein